MKWEAGKSPKIFFNNIMSNRGLWEIPEVLYFRVDTGGNGTFTNMVRT